TSSPATAEMIATIDRYSRNQLGLITSVLDFTRLSSGRVSLNVERLALAPLLAEIQALQSARLRSPDVALTVTVEPEVAEIETDRVKIQEIVRNLVDNAVKFTEAGRIAVRAHLAEPGRVAIDVADSGPGIPAEDIEVMFDAFHQLGASSTRGTGGVGLGLSIVRQLAEALGGSVSATSRLGEGSLFRVLIPCVAGPEAADPGSSAPSALDAAARTATAPPRRARSPPAVPVPEEGAIDGGHAHLSPADVRPQRELEEQRVSGRAPALDLSAEVRHEREEIPERLLAGIEPDRGRQPRRLQAAIGMENSAEAFGIDRRPPEVRELRDERPGSIFRRLAPLLTTKGAKLGGNALDGKAELLAHRV